MREAVSGGVRRVWSAPALLAAVAVLSLLYPFHLDTASRRTVAEFAVVASFLLGGIIDRYARMRPTRGFGFFGACGRHAGAMLRLAAVEVLLVAGITSMVGSPGGAAGGIAGVSLFLTYARVRLVVEDRRSALGALNAGTRFVTRNPAAWIVFMLWSIPIMVSLRYARGAAPIFLLPLYASAIALFQSRLAHAGYAAAPPLEWPESPAAEAVANRR